MLSPGLASGAAGLMSGGGGGGGGGMLGGGGYQLSGASSSAKSGTGDLSQTFGSTGGVNLGNFNSSSFDTKTVVMVGVLAAVAIAALVFLRKKGR